MRNGFFQFKQFLIRQDRCAMKVCTDACIFGAWIARKFAGTAFDDKRVLDIGTGTGLLPLMLAQKLGAHIDAIEMDHEAYQQAVQNIEGSSFAGTIDVMHGDATTYAFERRFDLVLSNPPFYEHDLASPDTRVNLAMHDSGLTLRKLVEVANAAMTTTGYLAVLLPYHRREYFIALAAGFNLHLHSELAVKHSHLHPYFRSCMIFCRNASLVQEELIIRENNVYTDGFKNLLADYYLHL